ncbi:MAG: hypothetical protein UCN44_08890 [Enterocloster sp.]|nr:hypothetical protein [Enterocloster sp.]
MVKLLVDKPILTSYGLNYWWTIGANEVQFCHRLTNTSNSISNQKKLLEQYAKEHGFTNLVHFTDDGISGTRFVEVR